MAMDKSAADSYVYARASGILASSYVGQRARQLFSFNSLQELWSFVFKKELPVVPETLFAKKLEEEAFDAFISQFRELCANYAKPDPLVNALLHKYDYENLKAFGAAAVMGEKNPPSIKKITPFNLLDYSKWPNIKQITENSPLSWYNGMDSLAEQFDKNYRLDCQYTQELWEAVMASPAVCRASIRRLVGQKLSLDNVVWALRLRVYYNMTREQILGLLAYSDSDARSVNDVLVSEAVKTLDWDVSDYGKWKNWKHRDLLNPYEEGVAWTADPGWIANAYKPVYVRNAFRLFHMYPGSVCSLLCWFIIKRNEYENIITAAESLRLGADSAAVERISGISEVKNG